MRKFVLLFTVLVLFALALVPATAQTNTIADIVVASANDATDPQFTTLLAAVQAAGLTDALADPDAELTVFAPTDAAFAAIDPAVLAGLLADPGGALTQILTYHVAPGELTAADVVATRFVDTLQGEQILVDAGDDGVFLNVTSQVIVTDIQASNGVIHVIDEVLIPQQRYASNSFFIVMTGDARILAEPGGTPIGASVDRCQTFFADGYKQGYVDLQLVGGWVDVRVTQPIPRNYGQPGGPTLDGCP